ncbi:hypothetical protein WDU94_015469 [Cyamophila willieti]
MSTILGAHPALPVISQEEAVSFIDLPPSTNKVPEKGILKKACPYGGIDPLKEKWSESPQSETLSQCDNPLTGGGGGGETISEVERTLKSLNGYHEDILEALRNAAVTHGRAGPSSSTDEDTSSDFGSYCASSSSEDLLRRSIAAAVECSYKRSTSQDKLCDGRGLISQSHTSLHERSPAGSLQRLHHRSSRTRVDADEDEDGGLTSSGPNPIRIRNLEDLMRQLEYHSSRHMSPADSEDIRMSDPETERQYRIDTHTGIYFQRPFASHGIIKSSTDDAVTGERPLEINSKIVKHKAKYVHEGASLAQTEMKTQQGVVEEDPGWCMDGTGSPDPAQGRAVITGDMTEKTLSMKLPTIPAHPAHLVLPTPLIVKAQAPVPSTNPPSIHPPTSTDVSTSSRSASSTSSMISTSPNSSPTHTVLQVTLNGGVLSQDSSSPSPMDLHQIVANGTAKFPEYKH